MYFRKADANSDFAADNMFQPSVPTCPKELHNDNDVRFGADELFKVG